MLLLLLLLLLLVFSSVFISLPFHGRIWRLVHTCDINANANANGMQASWYVQSKHKEREIRKHNRSIFTRWPTMIELLPIHTCGKRTKMHSRKWKFVYSLRWRLRLHLHLRWAGSQWKYEGCLNLMCLGSECLFH